MYANTSGLASSNGAGGFGSLGPNSGQAGGTSHGTVSGGGATDPGDSGWRPEGWPTGDHSVQVNSPTATDSPGETAGITHGPAGMRLPAGEHPVSHCKPGCAVSLTLSADRWCALRRCSRSAPARRDASKQSEAPTSAMIGGARPQWKSKTTRRALSGLDSEGDGGLCCLDMLWVFPPAPSNRINLLVL